MIIKLEEHEENKIIEQILEGNKINAIKLYREFSGFGLKKSKDEVEKIEKELREKKPEKFVDLKEKKGCLGIIIFIFIGISYTLFHLTK